MVLLCLAVGIWWAVLFWSLWRDIGVHLGGIRQHLDNIDFSAKAIQEHMTNWKTANRAQAIEKAAIAAAEYFAARKIRDEDAEIRRQRAETIGK